MTELNPLIENAQNRLQTAVFDSLSQKRNSLIQAQTGMGKSHLCATTPWSEHPDVTGGEPIVLLSMTKAARDEAIQRSKEAGLKYAVLYGRDDSCPVAAGDCDHDLPSVDGLLASEWLQAKCEREYVPFWMAHDHLENRLGGLPCGENGPCESRAQWKGFRGDEEDVPEVDVIHATPAFTHTPIIKGRNVIFDERPEFGLDLGEGQEKIRKVATKLFRKHGSPDYYWENLIESIKRQDGSRIAEYRALADKIPDDDWSITDSDIHVLAPAIVRALVRVEPVGSESFAGRYQRVSVIVDGDNTIKRVYHSPDLSKARCVTGLDAHPSPARWKLETGVDFELVELFTPEENRKWRREIRNLKIVQIGDFPNYLTKGWGTTLSKQERQKENVETVIRRIYEKHDNAFRTCICPKSIEGDVREIMEIVGIENPRTMHYGQERSRNDFSGESVGLVIGCIDPGDGPVLGMVALLGGEAEPEMKTDDDGNIMEYESGDPMRETGRRFVGPDGDLASELNESVRTAHVMQSVGRYARDVMNPDDGAIVYVYSDLLPTKMVDAKAPRVKSVTDKQQYVEDELRKAGEPLTARQLVDLTGISKRTVARTANRMVEQGVARKLDSTGFSGATLYEYVDGSLSADVTLDNLEWARA